MWLKHLSSPAQRWKASWLTAQGCTVWSFAYWAPCFGAQRWQGGLSVAMKIQTGLLDPANGTQAPWKEHVLCSEEGAPLVIGPAFFLCIPPEFQSALSAHNF